MYVCNSCLNASISFPTRSIERNSYHIFLICINIIKSIIHIIACIICSLDGCGILAGLFFSWFSISWIFFFRYAAFPGFWYVVSFTWMSLVKPGLHCAIYATFYVWKYFDKCFMTKHFLHISLTKFNKLKKRSKRTFIII